MVIALAISFTTLPASATTFYVVIGDNNGPTYTPSSVTIQPGDTVRWDWKPNTIPHEASVTSGVPAHPDGLFDSGVHKAGYTYSYTFQDAGTFPYYCRMNSEMTGVIEVVGSRPLNISTRLRVQTGENVLIGGFIIHGQVAKKLIVRGMGPSLQQGGVTDVLADPVLELHRADGSTIATNDDWKQNQQAEIEASGIPPHNDAESAIVTTLYPGSYTAILKGKNSAIGNGLVEVYDLDQTAVARVVNISTRGFVEQGDNLMIGGFIIGNGSNLAQVIVRALGPSLSKAGISDALGDPTLQLRDGDGALVMSNNNWKDSQQSAIEATGIPPGNDFEAAVVADLPPGSYTAVVAGNNGTTGVGLVELYHLR
jgi:plastocyanin